MFSYIKLTMVSRKKLSLKIPSIFANLARLTFDLVTKLFPRRKLVKGSTKSFNQLPTTRKENTPTVNPLFIITRLVGKIAVFSDTIHLGDIHMRLLK